MLDKRTGIGIVVGSAIIAIGAYSLISSIGVQDISFDDTYGIGESTTYKFTAPIHSQQYANITGTSFKISLTSPGTGLQIKEIEHKNKVDIDWVHLEDGDSILKVQNTGDSELYVNGTFQALLDPILFTYKILIIIAGLVIIGFSSAFSVRKPRGF